MQSNIYPLEGPENKRKRMRQKKYFDETITKNILKLMKNFKKSVNSDQDKNKICTHENRAIQTHKDFKKVREKKKHCMEY
jgi:hypothetical protein